VHLFVLKCSFFLNDIYCYDEKIDACYLYSIIKNYLDSLLRCIYTLFLFYQREGRWRTNFYDHESANCQRVYLNYLKTILYLLVIKGHIGYRLIDIKRDSIIVWSVYFPWKMEKMTRSCRRIEICPRLTEMILKSIAKRTYAKYRRTLFELLLWFSETQSLYERKS